MCCQGIKSPRSPVLQATGSSPGKHIQILSNNRTRCRSVQSHWLSFFPNIIPEMVELSESAICKARFYLKMSPYPFLVSLHLLSLIHPATRKTSYEIIWFLGFCDGGMNPENKNNLLTLCRCHSDLSNIDLNRSCEVLLLLSELPTVPTSLTRQNFSLTQQCPTLGPRTGTGPRVVLYRATRVEARMWNWLFQSFYWFLE